MGRVAVVATGGTIQNTPTGRVDLGTVWDRVRGYAGVGLPDVELVVRDVLRQGAESFGPHEWKQIADAVQAAVDDSTIDGVVVTHGTFTAEETAYLLHLVTETTKPVVVTVSQRKHSTVGNDGDKNLLDAVRVASTPAATGQGVLVVVNEEVHCAREVTKEHQRPGGFVSAPTGPLGTVETDAVSVYHAPLRRHTHRSLLRRADLTALPRVDIVAGFAGADGTGVAAAIGAGARGILLAGFAYSGRGTDAQMDALADARRSGVAVVVASRGRGGRIPAPAEADDHGFTRADNLTPQKARILAMVGLSRGGPETLQELYDTH
jgi:L-asparaginase